MVATSKKTIRKHIFLHPVDKKRRYAALKDELLKNKRKYCDKLEGALLDVSSLKVVGERHLVVEGYISMEVEADCQVFTPKPGQKLEGVINKQSFSHLGCLVMDIFNAALSHPDREELKPQLGDVVSFVVTEVVVDGDILFLRGAIESIIKRATPVNVSVKQERVAHIKQESKDTSDKESPEPSVEASLEESETLSPVRAAVKTEPESSDADSPTKHKKKKKKKSIKEEAV